MRKTAGLLLIAVAHCLTQYGLQTKDIYTLNVYKVSSVKYIHLLVVLGLNVVRMPPRKVMCSVLASSLLLAFHLCHSP